MNTDVLNREGEGTGRSIELADDVFGIEPHEHSVYLAVRSIQGNRRRGTHSTKERNEVRGSTRKIKRQKGTGTARAGDIKNPIFRGGGRVFGPKPRSYTYRLNKKVRRLALCSVLSQKVAEGQLKVVEEFTFDKPKTKEYKTFLNNLEVDDQKTLFVTADRDEMLFLSSRNIPNARLIPVNEINTYDVLNADVLIMSEEAIGKI